MEGGLAAAGQAKEIHGECSELLAIFTAIGKKLNDG